MSSNFREFKLVGVPMRADQDTFKVPVMPGWKMVAATRGTFGAQLIFEKEEQDEVQEKTMPLCRRD
jgi:hypothetical protein